MSGKNESFETKDFAWMVAMSILFLLLVVVCFWREFSTEWGSYQREFPQLLGHYGKVEDARLPPGDPANLGSKDRCDRSVHHVPSRLRVVVGASRYDRRAAEATSDEPTGSRSMSSRTSDARRVTEATARRRQSRGRIRADADGKIRCCQTRSRRETDSL
jgi:hypothetical protein